MGAPTPAPGWYPDAVTGQQRYFDGTAWGPAAPETPPPKKPASLWKVFGVIGAIAVVATIISVATGDKKEDDKPTSTASAPSTSKAQPSTSAASPWAPAGPDRLAAAYLDDDTSDQAFWARAAELLKEQDDVVVVPDGDMRLTVVHEGRPVTLYRTDLDSIAFNACSGLANGDDLADTVGWIKDAFDMQRRWEAGQIRQAAAETKCPTLTK
ncbi:hypothetical protein BH09ACT7_BH09ACT7_05140 [soil metagenome]